jgi:hypothetical protein
MLIGALLFGNSLSAQKTPLLSAEEFLEKEMIDSAIFHSIKYFVIYYKNKYLLSNHYT